MPAIAPAVFELIDRLAASSTVSDVWNAYLAAARQAGFEYGLAFFANQGNASLCRRSFHDGMPAGWLAAYSAAGCEPVDPIAARLRMTLCPFTWRLKDHAPLPPQRAWYDLNESAGVKFGMLVPDKSSPAFKAIALTGRSPDTHPHDRMALQLAGFEALHRMESLGLHPPARDPDLHLSERECECLKWIAVGKTDWEIGQILSISEKTVNIYVQRAKHKLKTKTRSQTVIAALRHRFINP